MNQLCRTAINELAAASTVLFLLVNSLPARAQVPVPAPVASSPDAQGAGAIQPPQVFVEDRAEQLAVCTKVTSELSDAPAELGKVVMHVNANDIWLAGGPFVVFDLNADNKLTGTWLPCAPIRRVDSLPNAKLKPPYFELTVPALVGVRATCPKQPPGPVACKAALADYLTAKGLFAIGAPRLSDGSPGPNQTLTVWVPYALKPKAQTN